MADSKLKFIALKSNSYEGRVDCLIFSSYSKQIILLFPSLESPGDVKWRRIITLDTAGAENNILETLKHKADGFCAYNQWAVP